MGSICRSCGADGPDIFLDLGEMPLVGSFHKEQSAAREAMRYPLAWAFCGACGLVQVDRPVPDGEIFNDGYSFATGTVPALVRYFDDLAEHIVHRFKPKRLLEFGSNDGTFLASAQKRGVTVTGVDPADNVSALARAKGLDIVTDFLTEKVARDIVDARGRFDVVTGSNCFAHNESEHPVLAAICALLRRGGILCIEVMYALDAVEQRQWDGLYHEHAFLYSLKALTHLLAPYGLAIFDAERTGNHGGTLRIFASYKENRDATERLKAIAAEEDAAGLGTIERWLAFGRESRASIEKAANVVGELAAKKPVWGYGASGRAAMWANACGFDAFEALVDASPLRYGRYLPGVATPVISVEQAAGRTPPELMFIYAWNYREDIVRQAPFYRGRWATPLPELSFF